MGLRERNAEATRRSISSAAMVLFFEQGFETTTMEEVAVRADVGTSTLYRYFPTKESLVLGPLGPPGTMALELARRPESETDEEALGHAVVHLLVQNEWADDPVLGRRLSEMVSAHPRLSAQMLTWLQAEERLLRDALADRAGLDHRNLQVAAAAWMAVFILQQVTELRNGQPGIDAVQTARRIMSELQASPLHLPAPPDPAHPTAPTMGDGDRDDPPH